MKELYYFGSDGSPLFAGLLESKLAIPKSTIILLHGGGPDHKSMLPLGELLKSEYRVILPDLRGYGRSICRDKKCYTWKQYSEDLISLIDHIDACSVILIGAGIGTTISLKAALNFPERIHGLILISIEDIEDDAGKELEVKLLESFSADVEAHGIQAAWTPLLCNLSPVIGDMVRDAIPRSDASSIAAAASIVYDRAFKGFEELKDITIPTLVIPGNDHRHPSFLAERIAKLLVNGHLSEVPFSNNIKTIGDFTNTFVLPIKEFLTHYNKINIKTTIMETLKFKTNIKCGGCIAAVTPHLNQLSEIEKWSVDTENPEKVLTVEGKPGINGRQVIDTLEKAGYKAEQV